ncbi:DNA polymerase V-like protein [Zalerion maritima]|uniref:DNA polymerase V-like protein n=1 Tax=Zalerion maritima TaxID=339359 RepID=A0AAD5RTZ1_9PEZI|nr:DNA polymerase V-like protein [Zalerion maritima]
MGKRKRSAKESGQPSKKKAKNEAAKARRAVLSGPATPFVSNPTLDDRAREAYLYENLGSEVPEERTKAAVIVVSSLQDAAEDVLIRHLEKRLFRGLPSGRNASRLGFSLVITELLRELFGEKNKVEKFMGLSFDKTLDFLVDKTQVGGNIPGQEERDHYFGQLFGLQCFVEANILFADKYRWTRVLGLLLKLAGKKVWLKSQCGWVIVKALQQMDEKLAVETLERVSNAGMGRTPEGVGMWLVAIDRFPGIAVPEKPWKNPLAAKSLDSLVDVLKEKKPPGEEQTKIKQGNWTAQLHFVWDIILAHYLKPAGKSDKDHGQQFKVFWAKVVDDGLFSKSSTEHQKFSGFSIFEKILEGGYSEPSILENLFSKNLMICTMNQSAKKDRYLHEAATKALSTIERTAEKHPEAIPTILKQLLGKRGAYNFDQKTNHKTVLKCLQFTRPVAGECLSICQKPLMKLEKSDAENVTKYLHAYAEYLSKLASAAPLTHEATATTSKPSKKLMNTSTSSLPPGAAVVKELATFAYSNVDHSIIKPALTPALRGVFRSRLEHVFAKLVRRPSDSLFLCDVMQSVNAGAVSMDKALCNERDVALVMMRKLLKDEKKTPAELAAKKGLLQGLALLYAAALSQLYAQDPDAVNLLQDLARVVQKIEEDSDDEGDGEEENSALPAFLVETLLGLLAKRSVLMRQVSVKVFEAFSSTMDLDALQLLTDTLFAEENEKGYRALFEAGGDEEEIADDGEVEDDDGDDSSASSSDGEYDSDVEVVGAPGAKGGRNGVVELDSDVDFLGLEDASDVEEVDNNSGSESDSSPPKKTKKPYIPNSTASAENLAALDDALAKLFKSRPLNPEDPSHSSSGSSDDEESNPSDTEMLALDAKLSEIFRQRLGPSSLNPSKPESKSKSAAPSQAKQKQKSAKEAKETVVNFKRRVLDLLDAFLRTQPLNPLAFELLLPLLAAMRRGTGTKLVSSRAGECVEGFFRGFKKARKNASSAAGHDGEKVALDADALKETLAGILGEASRDETHAFARVASKAALTVVTAFVVELGGGGGGGGGGAEDEALKFVDGLYDDLETKRDSGEAKAQKGFLDEYRNWRRAYVANRKQQATGKG